MKSERELADALCENALSRLGYTRLLPDGDFQYRLESPDKATVFAWAGPHDFLFGCRGDLVSWSSSFCLFERLVFENLDPPSGMSWQELALVLAARGTI